MIGAVSRWATGELTAHAEPLAEWIVDKAVQRLPSKDQDRFREEWHAHLNELPGIFRKLWHAVGCHIAVAKAANVLSQQRESDDTSVDKLFAICNDILQLIQAAEAQTVANDVDLGQLELATGVATLAQVLLAKRLRRRIKKQRSNFGRAVHQKATDAICEVDALLTEVSDPRLVNVRRKLDGMAARALRMKLGQLP